MSLPAKKKYILVTLGCLLGAGVAVFILVAFGKEAVLVVSTTINRNTHPALLLGFYAILPIFGFPITVFLILFGVKFGSVAGCLLIFAFMPIHLFVTLVLSRSFLGPWIRKIAEKRGFTVPQVPPGSALWFSFLFMLFPGLPYSLKNFLLALSGVSVSVYFLIGCLVNAMMALPLVILGDAAGDWNLLLIGIVTLLFLIIALGRFWIKRRFQAPGKGS